MSWRHMTRVCIRKSPCGYWIARIWMPSHPGDKARGATTRRFPDPGAASTWLGGCIQNHLAKRARFTEGNRIAKAKARVAAEVHAGEAIA